MSVHIHAWGQQIISQVKNQPLGSVVTTTGTITVGKEFGWLRYMQDSSAGVALYSSQLEMFVAGDSIIVTGVLSRYRGELQLSPVMSVSKVAAGRTTIALEQNSLSNIHQSSFESRKVLLHCAGINSCEGSLEEGWFTLYDAHGDESRLRVQDGLQLEGYPISDKPYHIEGIWTILEDQRYLQCLRIWDDAEGTCMILPQGHASFDGGQVFMTWNKLELSAIKTEVHFGATSFSDIIDVSSLSEPLTVMMFFPEVMPGKLYQARLVQHLQGGEVIQSISRYFTVPSTQDRSIEILFNRTLDTSYSDGSAPLAAGPSVIETDLIQRLDQVDSTLDIAMYNTNRDQLVNAVDRAVQRGVTVRYIADDETNNGALDGTELFPVYYRSGDGIMHHKFVIADAHDPDNAWVWTGSTNWSTNQLTSDPNHAYIIHDPGLTQNYLKEFNEMWGINLSHEGTRTGDLKLDNSAHDFQVDGITIESYFSPSDQTNCHLIEALRSAQHHVQIGLLLLTKYDLTDEMISLHRSGIDVRVILEDEISSDDALARLRSEGVPVAIHDFSAIFHHKYAIIDEGFPDSDPQVVTGSHNWTWSADNINDENTLIIHDQSITNIFRQEFEARWAELHPTSVYMNHDLDVEVYPNPASDVFYVATHGNESYNLTIQDVTGRMVLKQSIGAKEVHTISFPSHIPSGIYFLVFEGEEKSETLRLIKQ